MMMLQSLATLLFVSTALGTIALLALLVRADWLAISDALGLRASAPARLPARIRRVAGARATMIRINPRALRRAA